MPKGLNRATLIGNMGKDPELRSTQSGTSVCSFSLAVNTRYKGKDGKVMEQTDWVNVVCWGSLADLIAGRTRKGSRLYIEGRISTRSYTDKSGQTKYATEVVASEVNFLDGLEQGGGYQHSDPPLPDVPSGGPSEEDDEDLPF